jgi:hypothetical protein
MTTSSRSTSAVLAAFAIAALGACGGPAPPPQPGQMRGTPPDLRGRRVAILPVQIVSGVPGDADAEIEYAFRGRSRDVAWIGRDEIAEAVARAPGLDTRTNGLPVGDFLRAEVRRIGDPLFGQLRRMAALVDADAVFLPVALTWEANQNVEDADPRVRLTATLISPRTGQVLWFGISEGDDFERTDPRALVSAVERVARTMLWYEG